MPIYTDRSGRRWNACSCLVEWLPVYEQELIDLGVIRESIDVTQLIGGYAASGGTHSTGGAFDIWQTQRKAVQVARYMGAAAWARTRAQGFAPHIHGVLNGCPHNSPARYQIAALHSGHNGLGRGGRGGRDDGPRNMPIPLRTYKQGIAWAKARQAKRRRPVSPAKPITPAAPKAGERIGKWMLINHGAATVAMEKPGARKKWEDRRVRVVSVAKNKRPDVLGGLECGGGSAWRYISTKYRKFGYLLVVNAGGRALWRHKDTTGATIYRGVFKPTAHDGDVKELLWMVGPVGGAKMLTGLAHLDSDASPEHNVRVLDECLDFLEAKAARHKIGRSQIVVMIDMADKSGKVRARAIERGYGSAFDVAAKSVGKSLASMTYYRAPVEGPSVDEIFVWVGDEKPGVGPDRPRPVEVASKSTTSKPTDLDHLVLAAIVNRQS